MSSTTLTPAESALLAEKRQRAAERAAGQKRLEENIGPPVAAPLPTVAPSFPTRAVEVVAPQGVGDVAEGLSADCVAADAAYNESVAAWNCDREKLDGLRQHACAGHETIDATAIRGRRDAIDAATLKLAQDAVRLTREYVGRGEARAAELKTFNETCQEKLASVEEEVAKQLNAAGVSVETQAAWPHSQPAASIQFAHRVKESANWQAAAAKSKAANAEHRAAVESVTAGKARLAEAEKHLTSVVRRLAGV